MKEIISPQKDDKALYELMLKEKTEPSDEYDKPHGHFQSTPKDKILDNFYDKMGYSRYQVLQIFLICLLNVAIGAQSIFLNIVELQLIDEWNLQMYQAAMLVSGFSFGIAIGGYAAGYIADNFGRRKALLYSTFILFVLELFATFINQYTVFLIINFFISILVGIASLACMSYLVEWLPIKNRSLVLSYSQLYPLGMIILNSFALLAIVDDKMIYWKWLQRSIAFTTLICFFILKIFCYESPKFFISRHRFDEVFYVLDKVGQKAKVNLTEVEKMHIMEHATQEECHQIETSFKELFKGVFVRITLVIISFRLLSSLLNYGSLFVLPILLGKSEKGMNNYDATLGFLYTNLLSLPAPFVRGVLTEINFLGRKYTIFLCCFLALIGFVTSLYMSDYLMFTIGFARLSLTIASGTLVIYNTEAFPTRIRTLALGVISGITRIGAISSPYVCYALLENSIESLFYCFIIVICVCAVLCLLLPMDTKGLSLDNMKEMKKKISAEDLFKLGHHHEHKDQKKEGLLV